MLSILALFVLPGMLALSTIAAEPAPSLDPLQGKWSISKTNREGERYTQVIEIKKDQLTFQIFDAEKQLQLVAKGPLKTEKAGPVDTLSVSD